MLLKENLKLSDRIETFMLVPDKDRINEFLLDEMKFIPVDEKVLDRDQPETFWSRKRNDIVYSCGAYTLKRSIFNNTELLARYRHSLSTGTKVDEWKVEERERDNQSTLYTAFEEDYTYFNQSYIQLSEPMYKLHLLEQGKFTRIADSSMSELKGLFIMSDQPISVTSLTDLAQGIKYGLVSGKLDEINAHLEASSKVYKKLK